MHRSTHHNLNFKQQLYVNMTKTHIKKFESHAQVTLVFLFVTSDKKNNCSSPAFVFLCSQNEVMQSNKAQLGHRLWLTVYCDVPGHSNPPPRTAEAPTSSIGSDFECWQFISVESIHRAIKMQRQSLLFIAVDGRDKMFRWWERLHIWLHFKGWVFFPRLCHKIILNEQDKHPTHRLLSPTSQFNIALEQYQLNIILL